MIDEDTVAVEVQLEVPVIVPFFPRRVGRTAVEPIEEIVVEAER